LLKKNKKKTRQSLRADLKMKYKVDLPLFIKTSFLFLRRNFTSKEQLLIKVQELKEKNIFDKLDA